MDITSMTAAELGKRIKNRELSAVEAVKAYLAQIDRLESDVHSFVTVDQEGALKRAREIQKKIDKEQLFGPLAGVPVAVKDNLCTKGMLTTCSSGMLENFKYHGNLLFWSDKKSMESQACPWRLLRGLLRGSGGRGMRIRTWLGYRRIHQAAKFFLRCDRDKTDLWNGLQVWADCIWILS